MTYSIVLNGHVVSQCQSIESALQVVRRIALDPDRFNLGCPGPFFGFPVLSLVMMELNEPNG